VAGFGEPPHEVGGELDESSEELARGLLRNRPFAVQLALERFLDEPFGFVIKSFECLFGGFPSVRESFEGVECKFRQGFVLDLFGKARLEFFTEILPFL